MRKLKYWQLLPLLSLFIFFVNSAVAYGTEGGQEQVMTLQETPADQLAEMKALISRKTVATQAQRVNPLEGRPRQNQVIRSGRRNFELNRNLLALPEVDEGRFGRHSLSKAMVVTPITVTGSGGSSTTLAPGDSLEIVLMFSDSLIYARASFWVDMDGNGLLDDTIDFDIDEGGLALDNGPEDGLHEITSPSLQGCVSSPIWPSGWMGLVCF